MNNKQIETIVLIHEPRELGVALKRFPQCKETLYCTLTPHASDRCEKEEIRYVPLEDFGLNADPSELREEIHKNLLEVVALADQITQKHHNAKPYISPYRASFRRLAVLLSGTRVRVHYLSSLIAETQAKRIVWFGKPAQVLDCYKDNEAFSDYGSVEIALLKFQPWDGIDLIDCSDEFKDSQQNQSLNLPSHYIKQNLLKILKQWDLMHSLNFQIKMFKTSNLEFVNSYLFSSKDSILIENYTPFLLETCKLLLRQGYKINHIKDYTFYMENWKSFNASLEKELREALLGSSTFKWKEMDWTDFIFPLIKYLSSLVDPLRKIAEEAELFTMRHQVKCLLTIGAHRAHKYALIKGAKMAGAKIITFQHGGFGAYGGVYMGYDDLRIGDFHVCPGQGDVLLHEKLNPNFANKCRPLGFTNSRYKASSNLSEGAIPEKATKKKNRNLLYITTHYYLNKGIFLELGSPWIDNLVYKNQKALIYGLKRLMAKCLELKTTMKLHPLAASNNIPSMGKDFVDDRFTVVHKKPNTKHLLDMSDVILIDTPATSLIESVATRNPIFVLSSNLKLFPDAKELLMKRAIVKENPHELISALENYFLNGLYPADIENTEYLSFFSDPFGDGRLMERAADLVVETCSNFDLN
ncbi:hypothetical protein JYT29_01575 [Nitrospina gracilis]|nr:hypothetical protein [Nitrospina gracilis]